MAMTLHDCPDVYVDNNGIVTNPIWKEWLIDKYKIYPREEALYEAAQNEPRKTFKKTKKRGSTFFYVSNQFHKSGIIHIALQGMTFFMSLICFSQ